MRCSERHSKTKGYRYSFNGMERDDEVSGAGNSYTTHFRQYDPRLGRWLGVDPKAYKYPNFSSFNSMENNPIVNIDPFGDEVPTKIRRKRKQNLDENGVPTWRSAIAEFA